MGRSYIPQAYYGLIPGSYRERGGPRFGLVPWPAHLQPCKASAPQEAKQSAPEAPASLVNAGGVFFVTLSLDDRAGIATTIDRLIGMLDVMDGDENLEDGGDLEPNIGWASGERSSQGFDDTDEREVEDEHGGNILDQPHDDDELEPFLGWSETCGNGEAVGTIPGSAALMDDPEAGDSALDFRGEGYWQARQALRNRNRLTPLFADRHAERVTIMPDGEQFRTFVPLRRGRP
jgi:hypothetical protein